jgi:hypothetical protein
MEPESSLTCSQEPDSGTYPNPDESILLFFQDALYYYYYSVYSYIFRVISWFQHYLLKLCVRFSGPPNVLHVPPISAPFI